MFSIVLKSPLNLLAMVIMVKFQVVTASGLVVMFIRKTLQQCIQPSVKFPRQPIVKITGALGGALGNGVRIDMHMGVYDFHASIF